MQSDMHPQELVTEDLFTNCEVVSCTACQAPTKSPLHLGTQMVYFRVCDYYAAYEGFNILTSKPYKHEKHMTASLSVHTVSPMVFFT